MARLARIVAPGMPHHIIQRGNRRQKVFFKDDDKNEYLQILRKQGRRYGVRFWAYCLMDNQRGNAEELLPSLEEECKSFIDSLQIRMAP